MPSTRELKRRIKSVKNTAQITKAMQMISATKMRKAQNQALAGRPYSADLTQVLFRLIKNTDPAAHQLMRENDGKKIGIILVTSDKGLSGALNTNLFRGLLQFLASSNHSSGLNQEFIKRDSHVRGNDNYVFFTVGKKGRQFVMKLGKELSADFENHDLVTFRRGAQLAQLVVNGFLAQDLKEVYIAYSHFVSTLRQEPKIVNILPVDPKMVELIEEDLKADIVKTNKRSNGLVNNEFLFEPSMTDLLEYALLHYIDVKIYQALLETKASEHSARMMAMQNATDNAKELVEELQLQYNQTRQDAITKELLEITTAAAAMN